MPKGGGFVASSLTKNTKDYSDGYGFSFSLFCDRCGKEWISPKFRFSGAESAQFERNNLKPLLWSEEHRAAFDRANLEGMRHFNYCEKRGEWLCDQCFYACGGDGSTLCNKCFSHLGDE
jgi:hypothetical protein